MKYFLTILTFCITLSGVKAQSNRYFSTGMEMIFSFAKINQAGNEMGSNLRWSPVFNWQGLVNHDITNNFGIFYGGAIRNVGFTYETATRDSLKKFRTYNIGIPIGFKLGNIGKNVFLFGGYEFELPFNYKEKTFVNDKKIDKFNVWFSDRVNWYTHSCFLGINFPGGFNLKFKYYINNFFNKNYTETVNGVQIQPYKGFDANVFYFSIDWNVFKDVNSFYKPKKPTTPENRYSRIAL